MSAGTLWQPSSWCDTGCLPPGRLRSPADGLRAAGRLAAVLALLSTAAVLAPLLILISPARRPPAWRLLAGALLTALGVRHEVRGHCPDVALLTANHVSWLDILILLAHLPARPVAKHEVRGWPVIGRLATGTGTIFIDRTRPRTLPAAVAQVTAALRSGRPVAVFPEGTTWCGRTGGMFRPAMFQAAIDASVPVVPVSLHYRSGDGRATTVAAFVGDDTLAASLIRVAGTRGLRADVRLHRALYPGPGAARQMLSRAARASLHSR